MKQICIAWALAVSLNSSVCADGEGLVAYWPFDEAQGKVTRDASRNRNDGRIRGATFIKSPKGHALQFDGIDDFVDCGIVSSLEEIERAGTVEFWFKPAAFQGGLVNWSTGGGWLDQRLVIAFKNYHGQTQFIQASSNSHRYRERSLDPPKKNA